jgi:hypothetical protein
VLSDSLWFCLTAPSYDEVRRALSKKKRQSQNAAGGDQAGLRVPESHENYGVYYEQTAKAIQKIAGVNRLMVFLTIGLVFASFYQGCLTKTSVENAARNFQESERAWIGPTEIVPSFAAGTPIPYVVDVKYIDAGRSPATKVRNILRLRTGDPIPTPTSGALSVVGPVLPECSDDKKPLTEGEGVLVIPNVPHGIEVNPEADVGKPIPMQQIANNQLGLYLTGCIDYTDEFGVWHRTHVCKYWSRHNPNIFFACQNGNSAF